MNDAWKKIGTRLLVRTLDALIVLGRWLFAAARWAAPPFLAAGAFLFRRVFVHLYKVLLLGRRAVRRVLGSSKSRFVFFLANRYVVHAAILALAIGVSAASLLAKDAQAADTGERTLLFSILSSGADEDAATVEDQTLPIFRPAGASYLGSGTLRAAEHVDEDTEPFVPQTLETVAGGSALVAPTATGGRSVAARDRVVSYKVEEGDTIGSIAGDFRLSVSTILWANNLSARDYIHVGDSLKIPPLDGVLHTVKQGDTVAKIASRYGAAADRILAANRLQDASDIRAGDVLIVPDGEPPQAPGAPRAPRPIAPIGSIFKPPSASPNRSTRFLWPTSGRRITQYFGVWERVHGVRIHTGLDIDGDYSSPIYAAEDGIVIVAGWGTGYGLHIDIDHGGGVVTRYGHSSKLFVRPGERVKRGQTIAMIGSTGYSTGTHVHFEVRIGGRAVNPIPYLR